MEGEAPRHHRVTVRALGIAVALVPLNAYWLTQSEVIWWTGFPTTTSLFSNVTFIVLLLALLNLGIRKFRPRKALSGTELLTIYVFLCFTSLICSVDFLEVLIPEIAHPAWYANPENGWNEIFFGTEEQPGPVPTWLIVSDQEVLRGVQEGRSSFYQWKILRAWAGPLLWWTTFIVALLVAIIVITMLFRKQWTENERLSFPVIHIPLEISSRLSSLLRNRLFWIGFGITAAIDILNGLHVVRPLIPGIPLQRIFDFRQYLVEMPWRAIGPTYISIYPFAIGLCYFLPTDLIFSCWFFFLFYRVQQVLSGAIGFHQIPGAPFIREQSAGGYLGLCAFALWISRTHLLGVWKKLRGQPGGLDDSEEPMSYRGMVLLLTLCTIYLVGFGVAAGGTLWVMVVFFLIYYAYSIAITRMRAELGPPAHDLHWVGPDRLLSQSMGTRGTGKKNLAVFALFWFFNRAYRSHAGPHAIEGLKIGERTSLSPRGLFFTMVLAVIVGLLLSYWAMLHSLYIHGIASGTSGLYMGAEPWNRLAAEIQNPKPSNHYATGAVGVGFLFSAFLAVMRLRFRWWVFHPVGYATTTTWSMELLWFSMLLAWMIKGLMLRYGGARLYRPAIPFFVGLVLGEFVIGSLWTIYGAAMGVRVYRFWG